MSFTIKLQKTGSEPQRVTKDVTDIAELTGELRSETSIIDPVIMFAGSEDDIFTANYLTIPAFNRSYFIRNIRSIRNGLVEITAHVDVLSSFADGIKSNSAIIRRQENKWNLYIDDGAFRVYQNPMVLTKEFPSGFDTMSYVLAVAGG